MPTLIVCSKRALLGYKIRAGRAFPQEYLELLFGTVLCTQVTVERFLSIPQNSTERWVNWKSDEDAQDLISRTESESGLDFIGTIHSHTQDFENAHEPSGLDNRNSLAWEEHVFAIDLITKPSGKKLSHDVRFYHPQTPIADIAFF